MKNISHFFLYGQWTTWFDKLHPFLISDGTRIDDNGYLKGLEIVAELIVCTYGQMRKFSIYFNIKYIYNLKNTFYPINIDY